MIALIALSLSMLCSVEQDWCSAVAATFQKDTGVRVAVAQKATGEALAQIAAEKANPKTDVWFGGTGDPHLQAAEQDLTLPYRSPRLPELQPWARKQAEMSGYKTVGIYASALGLGYNTEVLARKKLAAPACWKDLLRPEFRDEIQVSNPNSSGTAYTALATLVQLMGEEPAFAYMRELHKNVSAYPQSGPAPMKAVARGEAAATVTFLHAGPREAQAGFPVKMTPPCEGTGYEVGSMSIVKGARNVDDAKKFVDWALSPAAQKLGADTKQYQLPSNRATPVHPSMADLSKLKLIDYDFARYGSAAERRRLIGRWDREIGSQPR